MILVKVIAVALSTVFVGQLVKTVNPEMKIVFTAIGSLVIIGIALPMIGECLKTAVILADLLNLSDAYFQTILRIIGIAYLAEFAKSTCVDVGESAIAKAIHVVAIALILLYGNVIFRPFIELIQTIVVTK